MKRYILFWSLVVLFVTGTAMLVFSLIVEKERQVTESNCQISCGQICTKICNKEKVE